MTDSSDIWDYVVIGGGMGGCSAAMRLAQQGAKVCLLEAGPRLGGRAGSFHDSEAGFEVDFGQHVFLRGYTATLAFLESIGTRDLIHFPEALDLPFVDTKSRRISRLTARPLPPPLHLASALAFYAHLSVADRVRTLWGCRKLLSLGAESQNLKLDKRSALDWLKKELDQPESALVCFWEPLCLAALNTTLQKASAYLLVNVLAQGFLRSADDARIGFARTPLRQLIEGAVDRALAFRGSRVRTKSRVKSIERGALTSAWSVRLASEEVIHCRAVVLSVHIHDIPKLFPKDELLVDLSEKVLCDTITNIHLKMESQWRWPFEDAIQIGSLGTKTQWLFYPAAVPQSRLPRDYVTGTISASNDMLAGNDEQLKKKIHNELVKVDSSFRKTQHIRLISEKRATFSARTGQVACRRAVVNYIEQMGLKIAADWACLELPSTIEAACRTGWSLQHEAFKNRPLVDDDSVRGIDVSSELR